MDTQRADLTHHYRQRGEQRGVPHGVLRALSASDTLFLGHAGVRFRIIRHHETFWIAPQRDGCLLTVYARDRTSIDAWACAYLVNPDHTRHRLHNLPGYQTPDEAITQELTARWLEVKCPAARLGSAGDGENLPAGAGAVSRRAG